MISITVRAGPGFEHVLPVGTVGDSCTLELKVGATLVDVVNNLAIETDARFLTALHDTVVTRAQRGDHILQSGDVVDILPPLTGG